MNSPNTPSIKDVPDRPSITAEVIFGSLSKNCRGVGICKVDVHGRASSSCKKCPCRTQAEIAVLENGQVRFTFETARLNKFLFNRYFRNLEFPVPEGFVFTPELLQELGLSHFTVRPGIYPVNDQSGTVAVDFQSVEQSSVGKARRHMHLLSGTEKPRPAIATAS